MGHTCVGGNISQNGATSMSCAAIKGIMKEPHPMWEEDSPAIPCENKHRGYCIAQEKRPPNLIRGLESEGRVVSNYELCCSTKFIRDIAAP